MSSAAATSLISTPDRLLSFTAVALNRSPYLATLHGPALATTHLQAVSPRCQLIRGKFGVRVGRAVRWHQASGGEEIGIGRSVQDKRDTKADEQNPDD